MRSLAKLSLFVCLISASGLNASPLLPDSLLHVIGSYIPHDISNLRSVHRIFNQAFNEDSFRYAVALRPRLGFDSYVPADYLDRKGLPCDAITDAEVRYNTLIVSHPLGASISTDGGQSFTNLTANNGLCQGVPGKIATTGEHNEIFITSSQGVSYSSDKGSTFTCLQKDHAFDHIFADYYEGVIATSHHSVLQWQRDKKIFERQFTFPFPRPENKINDVSGIVIPIFATDIGLWYRPAFIFQEAPGDTHTQKGAVLTRQDGEVMAEPLASSIIVSDIVRHSHERLELRYNGKLITIHDPAGTVLAAIPMGDAKPAKKLKACNRSACFLPTTRGLIKINKSDLSYQKIRGYGGFKTNPILSDIDVTAEGDILVTNQDGMYRSQNRGRTFILETPSQTQEEVVPQTKFVKTPWRQWVGIDGRQVILRNAEPAIP